MKQNEKSTGFPVTQIILDSFQEYEGFHSLVLFSQGCNLDCTYCHNKKYDKTVLGNSRNLLTEYLTPLHQAVVFLGGEPTIWQNSLIEEVEFVHSHLNLKTKLFTNGTNPFVVKELLDRKILDSISIDFKEIRSPARIIGRMDSNEYLSNLLTTIRAALRSKIDLELRTTKGKGVNFEAVERYVKDNFPLIRHIFQEEITI